MGGPAEYVRAQFRRRLVAVEYPCGHKDLAGALVCRKCAGEQIQQIGNSEETTVQLSVGAEETTTD
jgi:hypothetical protein